MIPAILDSVPKEVAQVGTGGRLFLRVRMASIGPCGREKYLHYVPGQYSHEELGTFWRGSGCSGVRYSGRTTTRPQLVLTSSAHNS